MTITPNLDNDLLHRSLAGPGTFDLLGADSWTAPLSEFAAATGVTVSFYGSDGHLVSGPHTAAPLACRLDGAGFWAEGGLGTLENGSACEKVLHSGQPQLHRIADLLEIYAVPAKLDARIAGVFVCGWTPFQFSDPVLCDRFARQVGIPASELWALIRQQAPLTDRKLVIFGQMLQTLASALLKQLHNGLRERQTAACLRILNDASVALTAATTYADIGNACCEAITKLLPGCGLRILVTDDSGSLSELPRPAGLADTTGQADLTKVIKLASGLDRPSVIRMPIQAADASLLGILEVDGRYSLEEATVQAELAPLAAQVAVALQKVRLVSDLERERTTLDHAIAELKRVSRIRDEFLATISHELRTPLNSMLGWCQLLRSGGLDAPEREEALVTIERNATAQARLIDDLLDMSRIITGKLVLEQRPLNLIDILSVTVNAIRPAAVSKSQKLKIDFRRSVLPFVGDALRLQQIFWNLLSNAVKFTPEGGRISLTAEIEDGRIVVRVEDSGKGIRPEFIKQVFERFSQEDGSYTRRYGGLGLGLAIVRHLVEMHGGEVDAQSAGEGSGSAFTIMLPLNAGPHRLDAESAPSDQVLAGIRVLAVEDDIFSLRLLRATLEETGAVVRVATSAADALATVEKWQPDLIVSDIGLPGEDGYSLIRKVRELPPDAGGLTPAIALTGYNSPGDKVQALEAGYQKHLDKPLNRDQLLASLRDFIAYR